MKRFLSVCISAFALCHATAAPIDFVRDVRPIFSQHCYDCHGEEKQKSGLRLDVKEAAFKGGDHYDVDIIPGDANKSPLIKLVTTDDEEERMPPKGAPLSPNEIEVLTKWINEGAVWPDGVDLAKLEDKRDHWSFKPLPTEGKQFPNIPAAQMDSGPGIIDHFIDIKLREKGLKRSPTTDPVSLIRRLTFDLTGLPPSPNEVSEFVTRYRAESSLQGQEIVIERLINRLLDSPRYGERWAQHWLDVVRYADTHGFEVNTERPNAWPYRDYVIRAFNQDTPYDQFIKEQIVGDSMSQDAATGFLVTASVLLTGQIGKDAASIRLARQDSLDEIVNNIGQTFLGLSVGCARCHDHKFDPISAKDYYSMQAFVSGVEYADRKMRTPEAEARRRETAPLQKQVKAIDDQLAQFVPIAQPNTPAHKISAEVNTEQFASIKTRFVRFSIHDSFPHPSLGLIEPCIDEFEIWSDEPEPRNVALAQHGAKFSFSGSRVSAAHKPAHINDGRYGNESSWMADTAGSGWVQVEFPEPINISKVVWGRDRTGRYNDRLANSYTLQAGLSTSEFTVLAHVPPQRPTVRASLNLDRFTPVSTKRLRFTVLATTGLEPCIDELELINAEGKNVALASHGARIKTSGNNVVADRHEPQFVNDGEYGNSRSWMSNQSGKGWVEVLLPSQEVIQRVIWSRDRKGRFEDRLATDYRIEVETDEGWNVVADSTDRHPWIAGTVRSPLFTTAGLPQHEADKAKKLQAEKRRLQGKIKAAATGQLVFAGSFRKPDRIHRLLRGDPEQPLEEVPPAVLSALGDVQLPLDATEQERRKVLADWIANPKNPLTARVMVNRIWQGHFGRGLVETPSDMGRMGMKPSHPELLDWLANEFIRGGWSIKHLHRVILMSRTYQQSNRIHPDGHAADADVRLLWRYPTRRLEAESIRDSMLAVSGRLNTRMYGRGYDLFDKRGGLSGFKPVESYKGEGLRRMIYAHKVRRETEAVFGAFDCPDAGQSAATRRISTTPIQALNLFNSRFTLEESEAFARSIKQTVDSDPRLQVEQVYLRALNRKPTENEIEEAARLVQDHGLPTLCRVLFNSNEFLFIP